jgi:hypothetical protein
VKEAVTSVLVIILMVVVIIAVVDKAMTSVIIIIIHVSTFMQGIYNYIPETNHVSGV